MPIINHTRYTDNSDLEAIITQADGSPLYGEIEMFIQYLSVIPGITKENYLWRYIVYACIPFNLILSVMVNLITFLVYKKISILFS